MENGTGWTTGARVLTAVCTMLLTVSAGRPAVAAETDAATARVRSSDHALANLIDQATGRSETFRSLVTTIQASDGIVYVEPGACGHGVRACLKIWMHVSPPNRFLRIMIQRSTSNTDVDIMSAIGHELQHAIEILSEPAVTDGVTMFNFLKRTASKEDNRFETAAAVHAGDAVYVELRRGTRSTR